VARAKAKPRARAPRPSNIKGCGILGDGLRHQLRTAIACNVADVCLDDIASGHAPGCSIANVGVGGVDFAALLVGLLTAGKLAEIRIPEASYRHLLGHRIEITSRLEDDHYVFTAVETLAPEQEAALLPMAAGIH